MNLAYSILDMRGHAVPGVSYHAVVYDMDRPRMPNSSDARVRYMPHAFLGPYTKPHLAQEAAESLIAAATT